MYLNDEKYKKTLINLKQDPKIDDKDKEIILNFCKEVLLVGLSKIRSYFYLIRLRVIYSKFIDKPLHEMVKEDIRELIFKIETYDYTDRTKSDYKTTIKKFFQFLEGYEWFSKEYPEKVKWIRTHFKQRYKLPEEILTRNEIKNLLNACQNIRDKAFIHVLYESGCRIGEIIDLKLKDAEFDKYGSILIVNGKTGIRRIRLVESVDDLKLWIKRHPYNFEGLKLKPIKSNYLWVNINHNSFGERLDYPALKSIIQRLAKKIKIKKRVYPYLFRHSRATHLANSLTEPQMREYFGWSQRSNMASVYVHLSGRDIDRAILKLSGIEI